MRILIAEDSLTQAVDLRRRLEALGHEVVVTHDGRQAWERLSARHENLVISDWMMPEMSGLDLCRKIRAEVTSNYVYIILLTVKTHRHERLQGLQAGADDFLGKPIDGVELEIALKTARRIIDAQEALRAKARELEKVNAALATRAVLDDETGLRNAEGFRHALATAFQQSISDGLPLSLIHLKVVPEAAPASHHRKSDWGAVANLAARILCSEGRTCDIAGRLDDLGFGLLLPGLAAEDALRIGDRLLSRLDEELGFHADAVGYAGVATASPKSQTDDPCELTAACDAALAWAMQHTEARIAHRDCAEVTPPATATAGGFNRGR
ncbi:hypothetical protein OJF2_21340 [Aquisphaera giovannonii]|uniref:Response regulatory domain-containing protein n=1 Tax=Aquisphaera giovannonii TaxID=406548 RepID=A0A5B9W118_9BACT|nr:response regulator [Aquisphaera giovannonii]QEH33630.1 hypothetical protein OJF2_21340 [Aquisphaera giovannonii]